MKTTAQYVKGQLWIHMNGRNFVYEPEDKAKFAGTDNQTARSGDIISPMPGRITKILKAPGDNIQRGDAVIVMEAMKMEYTLKSDADSIVESIECKVGDQVTLGKCLAKLKAKS
jgi:acetyl/propionyl-CoA carboxylase alpha subunit